MRPPVNPLLIPDFVSLPAGGVRDQIADQQRFPRSWDFEEPLPEVVAALLPHAPGAFYDVGANTGYYSILVGKLDPTRTIRAFEPVPEIADLCRQNLDLNDVRADVRQEALADVCGEATLFLPDDHHGLIETSASMSADVLRARIAGSLTVPCSTLDVAAAECADEHIGFVKMDIEGCEHLALAGAGEVVARDRPLIVIEVLWAADCAAIEEFIDRFDYRTISLRQGMQVAPEDKVEFIPEGWNQLLVPRERESEILSVLRTWRVQASTVSRPASWQAAVSSEEYLLKHLDVQRRIHDLVVKRLEDDLRTVVDEVIGLHEQAARDSAQRLSLQAAHDEVREVNQQILTSRSWRVVTWMRRMARRP